MKTYSVATLSLIKKGQTTKSMLNQFALNVLESSKCDEQDVCQYMCDLFKGILHQATIRRALDDKYKKPYYKNPRDSKGRW